MNKLPKSYLERAGVEGAKAETEVAARVRAARVRRGAMVEVYEVKSMQRARLRFQVESIFASFRMSGASMYYQSIVPSLFNLLLSSLTYHSSISSYLYSTLLSCSSKFSPTSHLPLAFYSPTCLASSRDHLVTISTYFYLDRL